MNAEVTIKSALHSAMAAAFPEIEGATKDSTNPHFKSQYADLASVVAAVKPALVKQGLFFTQRTEPSEGGVIVETMVHHSGGESMSFGKLFVPANKNDAQGFGSALTYARRYSLMTAFGVAPEDDDGNAAVRTAEKVPGIHAIKQRLGKMMTEGNAMTDLAEFKALVKANRDDIKTIRDANHEWWTGDGDDWEGFSEWLQGRYNALTPDSLGLQMLLSVLETCESRNDLSALLDEHGAVAEALDGEESRRWEEAYNARETALMAAAPLGAG